MYPSKVYKTVTSNKFTGLFIYHDNQKKTLHLLANTLQPLSNIVKPRESTFLSLLGYSRNFLSMESYILMIDKDQCFT